MVSFIPICLADMLLNGVAALALSIVVCLMWLGFREKRQERQDRHRREREHRSQWGYE
jgi:membrane protein implicated in regulation of membrane protease activity